MMTKHQAIRYAGRFVDILADIYHQGFIDGAKSRAGLAGSALKSSRGVGKKKAGTANAGGRRREGRNNSRPAAGKGTKGAPRV